MDKALTQEEINTLLHEAQVAETAQPSAASRSKVTPFVFGKASRISKQQVQDVAQFHEVFAYRLRNRLSAYLQVTLETNLMSVDEVAYCEFIESLPQQAYVASINIQPMKSVGLLSIDLPGAFAMVDLMLGGNGKPDMPQRPATEIEEKVIQNVVDIACEELGAAWSRAVDIQFSFWKAQRRNEMYHLMPPYEKMLFLSFEVRLPDIFATLLMAFPAAISSILLRSLAKGSSNEEQPAPQSKPKMVEHLRGCVFSVEMELPPTRMRGGDLLALAPGQTILIPHRIVRPAVLKIAGHKMFTAYPVKTGKERGGVIHERFALPYPAGRTSE